ncbi:glucose-6-phosphate isomerase family protein [Serratia sp. AKBS12]|uniref:glucose-6-phosphate isomerase family protein n=1 Tax=Serratia sp. AKBS12 TaxID=2974597 RepID=UPI0021664C2A|nr:glucose-6-phosphate isomerase family protein [Serratia sp. AKBS12]MCS3407045.1 glucose-6-phosphate isomerase [Serratia sp. AKBS12]HEI8867002.1 glucose-6-phosphate isomerase [Serratia odorifera]
MKLTSIMPTRINLMDGCFTAPEIQRKTTTLGNLKGIFANSVAWQAMPSELTVYHVEMLPSPQQEGELYVGTTHLHPGRVGHEFFMTRGHFHQRPEQAEIYFGLRGHGLLLLQHQDGTCSLERVSPGSVHHIPSFTAHRLINIGHKVLSTLAVWPTVAGHNYEALQPRGFKLRVLVDGEGWKAEAQYE